MLVFVGDRLSKLNLASKVDRELDKHAERKSDTAPETIPNLILIFIVV